MRGIAATCGLISVLVLLTGCSSGGAVGTPVPTPPASTDSPATRPNVPGTIPTGTIGTGTLTSDNGTTGRVSFGFDGTVLTLHIDDLVIPTAATVDALTAIHPLPESQTCDDSGFRMDFGQFTTGSGASAWGDLGILSGDPSGIDQVILVTTPAQPDATDPDCLQAVVARADIRWTFEPVRSYLNPVDSGDMPGAQGAVDVIDGKPAGYTPATNEYRADVATRFGITADDLTYLNDEQLMRSNKETAPAGRRLNLLLADR